jgi:hypothetical protein
MPAVQQPSPKNPKASFYVAGGTLPTGAASYVARQADHDLLDALRRGEFCYVLNTRQMGKSSLMIRTAAQLRSDGFSVAVLDLTAIGQNLTPAQWYAGLLAALGEQLGIEDKLDGFVASDAGVGPMQRFFQAIRQVVLPRFADRLVVFVDEIDAVRSLPFSADEFFAGIRECHNRRATDPVYEKLCFCLLGVATPADLVTDTRISPFNIGRRIELRDFTREEAAPLAEGIEGGLRVLDRVLHWTGGHPYMTQRLCRAVAEEPNAVSPRGVDGVCRRLFLTKQARDTDDNLAFVRNRLLRSEADLAALLDLYQRVRTGKRVADDETSSLIPILRLSGITTATNGVLRIRNRIYETVFDPEWINEHMPGAELRRQRVAFKLGASRAGIAAVAIGLILVWVAWGVPIEKRAKVIVTFQFPERHLPAGGHIMDLKPELLLVDEQGAPTNIPPIQPDTNTSLRANQVEFTMPAAWYGFRWATNHSTWWNSWSRHPQNYQVLIVKPAPESPFDDYDIDSASRYAIGSYSLVRSTGETVLPWDSWIETTAFDVPKEKSALVIGRVNWGGLEAQSISITSLTLTVTGLRKLTVPLVVPIQRSGSGSSFELDLTEYVPGGKKPSDVSIIATAEVPVESSSPTLMYQVQSKPCDLVLSLSNQAIPADISFPEITLPAPAVQPVSIATPSSAPGNGSASRASAPALPAPAIPPTAGTSAAPVSKKPAALQ